MIAVFYVGNKETHRVEVEQPFIGRIVTVKVDDVVVVKHVSTPLPFVIKFSCGVNEIHKVELRINYLTFKYEVYVDDNIMIGCLFPQAAGYNAFGVTMVAFILAFWSFMFR